MQRDGLDAARIYEQDFTVDQEQCGISFKSEECGLEPSRTSVVKHNVYLHPWRETEENAWSSIKSSINPSIKTTTTTTHIIILPSMTLIQNMRICFYTIQI